MTRVNIPRVYVTRFFQLVTTRQFAEAERILERLKQRIQMTERNRGYFQALNGMLLTQRNNDDRYALLSSLNVKDLKVLRSYRREFLQQSEYRLHADYDRGFFTAWAEYMRLLQKLDLAEVSLSTGNNNKGRVEAAEAEPEAEATEAVPEVEETRQEVKPEESEDAAVVAPGQSTLSDFSE